MTTRSAPALATNGHVPHHVAHHYDAIRQHEQLVRQLEGAYLDARRVARKAKEEFDAADAQLRNLIADGPDPQAKLPFPPEPAEDAWRIAKLEELLLPPKLRQKLLDAGIETIGQLEDLRAEIALGTSDWPPGFGPSKISAVEDSVISWLTDHRDHFREPIDEAA
jgi:hypothetical protein